MDSLTKNNFNDPKIFGPGLWLNIHIVSLDCDNDDKINNFINYINLIASKLPCGQCKNHFLKYLNKNPLENYILDPDYLGMFKWSWKFHNTVNFFLKKPIINLESAIQIYSNNNIIPCQIMETSTDPELGLACEARSNPDPSKQAKPGRGGKEGLEKKIPTYGTRKKIK